MKKRQYDVDEQQLNTEAEAEAPEKSKKNKVLGTIVNAVLVIAILVAAFATYTSYVSTSGNGVPSFFGLRVFSIQTESMYPTLKSGDLIIDKAVNRSIHNLTSIGKEAMCATDDMVLNIMTHKS